MPEKPTVRLLIGVGLLFALVVAARAFETLGFRFSITEAFVAAAAAAVLARFELPVGFSKREALRRYRWPLLAAAAVLVSSAVVVGVTPILDQQMRAWGRLAGSVSETVAKCMSLWALLLIAQAAIYARSVAGRSHSAR